MRCKLDSTCSNCLLVSSKKNKRTSVYSQFPRSPPKLDPSLVSRLTDGLQGEKAIKIERWREKLYIPKKLCRSQEGLLLSPWAPQRRVEGSCGCYMCPGLERQAMRATTTPTYTPVPIVMERAARNKARREAMLANGKSPLFTALVVWKGEKEDVRYILKEPCEKE